MTVKDAPAAVKRDLPSENELARLVEMTLDEARRCGATAAEAAVSVGSGFSVNVRLGEVDTLEHQRDRSLAVGVYFGQRQGTASSADFSAESVKATVEAACTIAKYTSEDEAQGLADPALLARDYPELDLYHPWHLTPEQAIDMARESEATALAFDERIDNSEGASVSTGAGLRVYGNTEGFVGGVSGTRHNLHCVVVARDAAGMQRDYWYTAARAPEDLEPHIEVGRRAAERAVRRLGARRLSTRKVPVMFAPEAARGLLSHFVGAIRGGSLYRKASFLLDRLDTSVFPEFVQIREYPHLPRGLGSTPFDNEGVATRERAVVENGVLQGYVLDSYSARKLGMASTGNAGGVHNLTIEPGPLGYEELLADMGEGLLVTEMMGQGVNMVTGDYSRGASGFWVENGRIAYPVEEITVAGNLKDMFAAIRRVGKDMDTRGNIRTGSLVVDGLTVAGE